MSQFIETPWPGVVQEIQVSVGDTIEVDQEIIVIESMKMLTPVSSMYAGRVTEIHVAVGDFVNVGDNLLTLDL